MSADAPTTPRSREWTADAALLCVALIWGVNIPVMKYGVGEIDRLSFNALRLTLSATVLGFLAWRDRPNRGILPKGRIALVVLLGGLVYQVAFVIGIDMTLGGNTALILATTPMWTAVLAWSSGTDQLRKSAWLGLLTTCAGTAFVTLYSGKEIGAGHLAGNLIIVGASFLWASATVISKPLFESVTPTRLAFYCAAFSLPAHYALAAPGLPAALEACAAPSALGAVIYSGVFSTGVAYAMWNHGVRSVGPSHASIFSNLVPVVALACGWLFLRETITAAQIPGGLMILGGLLLMRRSR